MASHPQTGPCHLPHYRHLASLRKIRTDFSAVALSTLGSFEYRRGRRETRPSGIRAASRHLVRIPCGTGIRFPPRLGLVVPEESRSRRSHISAVIGRTLDPPPL